MSFRSSSPINQRASLLLAAVVAVACGVQGQSALELQELVAGPADGLRRAPEQVAQLVVDGVADLAVEQVEHARGDRERVAHPVGDDPGEADQPFVLGGIRHPPIRPHGQTRKWHGSGP